MLKVVRKFVLKIKVIVQVLMNHMQKDSKNAHKTQIVVHLESEVGFCVM